VLAKKCANISDLSFVMTMPATILISPLHEFLPERDWGTHSDLDHTSTSGLLSSPLGYFRPGGQDEIDSDQHSHSSNLWKNAKMNGHKCNLRGRLEGVLDAA
jgi:hypothetical protein